MAAASLAPVALGLLGVLYAATAVILGSVFIAGAWTLRRTGAVADAKRLFGFSILYLFLLFAAIVADRLVLA